MQANKGARRLASEKDFVHRADVFVIEKKTSADACLISVLIFSVCLFMFVVDVVSIRRIGL